MNTNEVSRGAGVRGISREHAPSRRRFLRAAGTAAAGLLLTPLRLAARRAGDSAQQPDPLRIGIIGSGEMGGGLGLLWAGAGHEVLFSSRHPDELSGLAERAGPNARTGYPEDAAEFGEVVMVAVPYGALPQVGRDHGHLMRGKVVIDCGNPYEGRDGPMATEALEKGTGVASAEYLPGVRLVRAFNTLPSEYLDPDARPDGETIGIPMAGDDDEALRIAARLVEDAGFEPVVVGPLSRAREFDRGTAVYGRAMTARELREALGL